MTVNATNAAQAHKPAQVNSDWLDSHVEVALDPERRIIDPHHHLWERATHRYLVEEYCEDIGDGHHVEASVFVECWSGYRASGPEHLRCVGETELIAALAQSAENQTSVRLMAGIVGHTDLLAGDQIEEVLAAHIEAGRGRFRGIRHATSFEPTGIVPVVRPSPPGLMSDPRFRDGLSRLGKASLSFDAWIYHTQLEELADLARAVPETAIILNHLGGPIGIGDYAVDPSATFALWKSGMTLLAACPNVSVKLSGLGMTLCGHGFKDQPSPPDSTRMAQAYGPHILTAIDLFGVDRCMFASNFPVDKISGRFGTLYNAYKRIVPDFSETEKDALFRGTAERIYRLAPSPSQKEKTS